MFARCLQLLVRTPSLPTEDKMSGKINFMKNNTVLAKSAGIRMINGGWCRDGDGMREDMDETALYPRILGAENLEPFSICSERERGGGRGETRWCHQDKKTAQNSQ